MKYLTSIVGASAIAGLVASVSPALAQGYGNPGAAGAPSIAQPKPAPANATAPMANGQANTPTANAQMNAPAANEQANAPAANEQANAPAGNEQANPSAANAQAGSMGSGDQASAQGATDQDPQMANLKAFDDFATAHPDVARELGRNPRLINSRRFLSKNTELRDLLQNNPELKTAFNKNPGNFVTLKPGAEYAMKHHRSHISHRRSASSNNGLAS